MRSTAAALALVLVGLATGCSADESAIPQSQPAEHPEAQTTSTSERQYVELLSDVAHFGPRRDPRDPLRTLPETSATSTLLVSTVGDEADGFVVIDLEQRTAFALDLETDPGAPVSVDRNGIWYVSTGGEIGYVGWDGEQIDDPRAGPWSGRGAPMWAHALTDGNVLIGVGETAVRTFDTAYGVVLGPDGSTVCRFDPNPAIAWEVDQVELVPTKDGSVIDTTDCSTVRPPDGRPDAPFIAGLDDGSTLWGDAENGFTRASRDGEVLAHGPPVGAIRSGWWPVVGDTALWIVDHELPGAVRIGLDDLLVEQRWLVPMECGANAYVIERQREGWLTDDCDGLLSPLEGQVVVTDQFAFPHDGQSDQEIFGVDAADGIWFVDYEQTGEPYFFDPDEARFERLPDGLRGDSIFALTFFVRPET